MTLHNHGRQGDTGRFSYLWGGAAPQNSRPRLRLEQPEGEFKAGRLDPPRTLFLALLPRVTLALETMPAPSTALVTSVGAPSQTPTSGVSRQGFA